jgi:heme-degrading monooxygenase HmoA
MSVVQTYILRAADGKADALADVCERMAAMVRPLPGCEAVSVLRDMKDGSRFIFTRRRRPWSRPRFCKS